MRLLAGLIVAVTCAASVRAGLDAYKRREYSNAFREWSASADKGNADAEYHLALLYRDGEGVPRDLTRAAALLKLSADQGKASSMNELGLLYLNGRGVPMDYARAYHYFSGASGYSAAALFNIGLMHEMGWGMQKDTPEACAWYTLAAEQGSRGGPGKRDRLCEALSIADRKRAQTRLTALRWNRRFSWLGDKGLESLSIVGNLLMLTAGVYVLATYAMSRRASPEARERYRDFARSSMRRWLLWYVPQGVLAWALHLLFYVILVIALITLAALATLPFDTGAFLLGLIVLGALALARALAIRRDIRNFGSHSLITD